MSFAAAVQYYGMFELRERFPDESEAAVKEVLSWVLERRHSATYCSE